MKHFGFTRAILPMILGFSLISSAFATDDPIKDLIHSNYSESADPIENLVRDMSVEMVESAPQPDNSPQATLLNAKAALVMKANSGEVLFQKNMNAVRSIASISKMMAAMVVLDAKLDMNEVITVTEDEIDRIKGTSSRLSIGTALTREKMLHLGLMSSENRAIHALGRTYPGGMSAFVAAMNAKAQSLGMVNTRFYEPTGLDPRNVSTAGELALMVKAANQYPKIRHYSTANAGEAYTSKGKVEKYKNSNALVREGQWNISVQKTGYIREAGRSMVLQANVNREPVIFVILGSASPTTRVNDARTLDRVIKQISL